MLVFSLVGACGDPAGMESPAEVAVQPSAQPSAAAAHPSPAQLGSRVSSVYRQTTELEFDARVKGMGREILCKVKSGPDSRHHLDVHTADGATIYTLDENPISPGRTHIQEHNLLANKKSDYVVTDEEFAYDKWDPRSADAADLGFDACLFGGYLHSWLGPTAHRSEFLERIIAGGTYEGLKRLGTSTCHVVATGRPQRPGEEVWIDRDTGLVRRWRDQWRDRVFDYRRRVASSDPRD